jgi:hypothetical protein
VSAELTDELHFLKALALVGMFFQPKAGLRVLTLLRKEKVAPEATDTVVLERSEVVLFFCHPIFQAVKVFPSYSVFSNVLSSFIDPLCFSVVYSAFHFLSSP